MDKYITLFLNYLVNERNYPNDTTAKNYELDLLNYQDFLRENNLNYLKITKDYIRSYLKY